MFSRSKLPLRAVMSLRQFFIGHIDKPFPSDSEKHELAAECSLNFKQVSDWFTNTRKRFWRPYCDHLESAGCILATKQFAICKCQGAAVAAAKIKNNKNNKKKSATAAAAAAAAQQAIANGEFANQAGPLHAWINMSAHKHAGTIEWCSAEARGVCQPLTPSFALLPCVVWQVELSAMRQANRPNSAQTSRRKRSRSTLGDLQMHQLFSAFIFGPLCSALLQNLYSPFLVYIQHAFMFQPLFFRKLLHNRELCQSTSAKSALGRGTAKLRIKFGCWMNKKKADGEQLEAYFSSIFPCIASMVLACCSGCMRSSICHR